jgi:cytochrome c-type biogenesis protein CcmF
MVALHSTALSDLYVIFEGRNPDTDRPIIKAFLNPLIVWIWIGVLIVVAGTLLALAPSTTPRKRESTAAITPELTAEVHHA